VTKAGGMAPAVGGDKRRGAGLEPLVHKNNRLVAICENQSGKLNNSLTLFITIVKMITIDFRNEDAPWLTTH
jgi:hypothetical protein